MEEFISILSIIGVFQGIFFGLVLFSRKNNRTANRFLALLLITITYPMLMRFFIIKEMFQAAFFTEFFMPGMILLHGPAIYFYSSSMTLRDPFYWKKSIIHFIPSILVTILHIGINIANLKDVSLLTGIQDLDRIRRQFAWYFMPLFMISSILIFIYAVKAWHKLRKYEKAIRAYYSDIEKISLRWIKTLIIFFILMFSAMHIIHALLSAKLAGEILFLIPALLAFAMVIVSSYLAISQQDLFATLKIVQIQDENSATVKGDDEQSNFASLKYERHNLNEASSLRYLHQLQEYMKAEKPFLDDSLTIKELADEIDIPAHHLSIIINQHLKQNFYQFISFYRVEEFQRLLEAQLQNHFQSHKEEKVNLLALAFESGFNSKSSFNQIFKNRTGMTPREYKTKILQDKRSKLAS